MNEFFFGRGWGMKNEQEYRNGGVVTQHAIVEGFFNFFISGQARGGRERDPESCLGHYG